MSASLDLVENEFITFKNSQGITARGTLLKISQNHIVFETYNPYSIVQLSEVLTDLTINRANKQLYKGKAVVTNIVNTGIILIVSASLSDAYWKTAVYIESQKDIQKEIDHLISIFDKGQQINREFKTNVLDIRSLLSDIKNWLDKLEPSGERHDTRFDSDFMLKNFGSLFDKINQLARKFHELVGLIDESDMGICKAFVQAMLHPFFMSSPFPYRCYNKPLGYAGDYEMMRMIQRENSEGPSLFAKFVNVFYTNIPIANSVKNRTVTLIEMIRSGVILAEKNRSEYYALSIGCGPALEVRRFIDDNAPSVKCHFKLLDFNEETLEFAVNQANSAKNGKNYEVQGELNSVHELLKRSVAIKGEQEKYDLVYCSGLFDYLSDRICARLIRLFFSMIKSGGRVLVTNMHTNNHDNHMMELLLEWHLIYRDESTMSSLVPELGEQRLFTDQTGVNLCLEITK